MDFSDTPDEANFRAEVRAWLKANGGALQSTAPDELYTEADIERCRQWQRKKAEAGYAHIVWPQEYGGMGGTWMQAAIFAFQLLLRWHWTVLAPHHDLWL